jgi:hypothetical protein
VYILVLLLALVTCIPGCWLFERGSEVEIKNSADVVHLFPKTPEEIKKRTQDIIKHVKHEIDTLIAIPDNKRTFKNTCAALDKAVDELGKEAGIWHTVF